MPAERFSASVAGRHMSCHASANLELAIPGFVRPPRVVGKAADAGTARHEMLDPILRLSRKDIEGFARILQYVADLRATRRFNVRVEEEVEAWWLNGVPGVDPETGDPIMVKPKTTPDYVLYVADELHVLDWKWGKIPVDVEDNEQLLFGAVTVSPLAPKAKGVHLHILQPYADNYASTFVDTNDLLAFRDKAIAAEAAIQAGDLTFGPHDKHCTFCPVNPHSRGAKAEVFCPVMLNLLYPKKVDEDEILALD